MSIDLYEIALRVGGYLGLFIVSVLGNLIPFIPIPYLAVVFMYSAVLSYDPLLTGVVSGLGGAAGKLIVYLTGRGASRLIASVVGGEERLEALKRLLGAYGALAAFLFAATPSPDDVVIVVLGMIRYDVYRFLLAVALGKIVISLAVAYGGWAVGEIFSPMGLWITLIASIVLLALATLLIIAVDWVKVLEVVSKEGWRGVWREIKVTRGRVFLAWRKVSSPSDVR
ncbi:MAG: hypothetical protein DRK00_03425 [Thermoprotei archaeon]|nr:MAG: hypothetical protein DRK00_03425 [Thermoprotei archaeon]